MTKPLVSRIIFIFSLLLILLILIFVSAIISESPKNCCEDVDLDGLIEIKDFYQCYAETLDFKLSTLTPINSTGIKYYNFCIVRVNME